MPYITKQELHSSGKWITWINTEGFNTIMVDTPHQLTEEEAISIRNNYLEVHLYDDTPKAFINVEEFYGTIREAVVFIKTTNPTLTQWNNYLASLQWDDAYLIRWFLARLAVNLADRAEVDLSNYTENQVLAQLKTWIINTPARRLEKVIFG